MLFFRQAGILKLRKKAGESCSKWFFVVFLLFPSPEFSGVRWVGKCSSNSFLPSSCHYSKAMSLISLQLNCLTVPAFCYDADIGAIVSSKVHVYYLYVSFLAVYLFDDSKRRQFSPFEPAREFLCGFQIIINQCKLLARFSQINKMFVNNILSN